MSRVSQFPKPFAIRDAIYGFIELDDTERAVLDSRPLQRLKHIHQLAMTYQIYPGATHKRFEHSLGVMELAGRAFDAIMNGANRNEQLESTFPEIFRREGRENTIAYWRRVVRMAGLCHDIGHLPFSHAAEEDLLDGETHETIGGRLILDEDVGLSKILRSAVPPINPEHVAKLALGEEYVGSLDLDPNYSEWESLLASIVVDDLLGVDRMDYLIRDSHHLGVAYGVFDSARLIQSLRAIPSSGDDHNADNRPFQLGADFGGLHAVEALILARYFMFVQVYFHHARLAYDLHLSAFMRSWINNEVGQIDHVNVLGLNDFRVLAAIQQHAENANSPLNYHATRIHERKHFKTLHSISDEELVSAQQVADFERLGQDLVEEFPRRSGWETRPVKPPNHDILISSKRGRTRRASRLSEIVKSFLLSEESVSRIRGYLYVDSDAEPDAMKWLIPQIDAQQRPH